MGFFFLYIMILLIVTFVIAFAGHDIATSFSTSLATLGNIGPDFGKGGLTENCAFYEDYIKWVLSFAMIVGRLELYTVLVVCMPEFWMRYIFFIILLRKLFLTQNTNFGCVQIS
ncbi:MAG: potassium transporter TrkG [Spirochaetota bacterium]